MLERRCRPRPVRSPSLDAAARGPEAVDGFASTTPLAGVPLAAGSRPLAAFAPGGVPARVRWLLLGLGPSRYPGAWRSLRRREKEFEEVRMSQATRRTAFMRFSLTCPT